MLLTGKITAVRGDGIFIMVDALRTEYGPLSYVGKTEDYVVGARAVVARLGTNGDEWIVLGHLLP